MAVENLTTWTESDAGDDLTVSPTRVAFDTMIRNVVDYILKDAEAGHFGDFTFFFEFNSISGDVYGEFDVGVSNSVGTGTGLTNGMGVTVYHNNGNPVARVYDYSNWTPSASLTLTGKANTLLYATLSRAGTTASFSVYSDAARTVQIGSTITQTVTNTTMRYVHVGSINNAWQPTQYITGYVQNVDLNEGAPPGGPFPHFTRRRMTGGFPVGVN